MKREAFSHPKMLDLAARLCIVMAHARGIIATLWNWAADAAFCGDVGKWNNGVIARACDWTGDADEFVEALIASGWLDRCAVHRLVIHDLEEHAPEWWKTKLKRIHKEFVKASQSPEVSQVPGANIPAIAPATTHVSGPANAPLCSALQTSTPLCKPKARKRAGSLTIDGVKLPAELDTPEARAAAADWLAHRAALRRPYASPESFGKLLAEWTRAGPAAFCTAVRHSIAQNYQGLFPLSEPRHGNHRHQPGPGQLYDANHELGPV